jgi:hypothetical protein
MYDEWNDDLQLEEDAEYEVSTHSAAATNYREGADESDEERSKKGTKTQKGGPRTEGETARDDQEHGETGEERNETQGTQTDGRT